MSSKLPRREARPMPGSLFTHPAASIFTGKVDGKLPVIWGASEWRQLTFSLENRKALQAAA